MVEATSISITKAPPNPAPIPAVTYIVAPVELCRYVPYSRRLPKRDDVQLAFADVPGSSVLVDKDGKETKGPVEELDFVSFISDIKRTDNTVTFEILPTKGIMTPPNRAQVDVTCVVTYTDQAGNERTFMETQRVNAISQPYRIDYDEWNGTGWGVFHIGVKDNTHPASSNTTISYTVKP